MYAWRKCTLFCVKKVCGMFAGLRKISTFASAIAEIAQLVEHNLAKVRVASSSLVFRSQEKATQVVFSFLCIFLAGNFLYICCGYYEEFDIFAPAIKKMKKHDNV